MKKTLLAMILLLTQSCASNFMENFKQNTLAESSEPSVQLLASGREVQGRTRGNARRSP